MENAAKAARTSSNSQDSKNEETSGEKGTNSDS